MWTEKFAVENYVYGTAPAQPLLDQAHHLTAGQSALVLADGEGRNGVFLAERGLQVTSLDGAPTGVAKAERLAAERGVTLDARIADLRGWDWQEAAFDVVVGVFFQFADPAFRAAIFTGIRRTVKPGGLVLLHGFSTDQMGYASGGPGRLAHLYTTELLAEAFAGWDVLRLESYVADLDEGSGHRGPAALMDLVARKPA